MRARPPDPDRNARGLGLALVVALHLAIVATMLAAAPVRRGAERAVPLIVRLIAAPADVPPAPVPNRHRTAARERSPRPVVAPPAPRAPDPSPPATTPAAPAATTPAVVADATPALPAPPERAPSVAAATVPAATAVPPLTPPDFTAEYLDNPPPTYPLIARRSGEQGRVLLRVLVAPSGAPEAVELRTSSGSPRLDHAAIETVKRWRFVPARRGSEPVAAWVIVPIQFTLDT